MTRLSKYEVEAANRAGVPESPTGWAGTAIGDTTTIGADAAYQRRFTLAVSHHNENEAHRMASKVARRADILLSTRPCAPSRPQTEHPV